jgi:hypothetical protein
MMDTETMIRPSIAAIVVTEVTRSGNVPIVLLVIEHRLLPVPLLQPLLLSNARLQPQPLLHLLAQVLNPI